LSQAELASLAGVSASAISQVERGRRGLSLETLLDLSARLNVTLDELLRGDEAPGYRLARRDDPRHTDINRPIPLLDDPKAGLRAYLLRLSPGASATRASPTRASSSSPWPAGSSRSSLPPAGPSCGRARALVADRSGVSGWRNLGDREAMVFWILHDESPPASS